MGNETVIPITKSAFKTLISEKARVHAHSGSLEASAVVLGLRRLLRSRRNHRHRIVYLVDAQAIILGGLRKGRSSAATIKRQVKQAAALQIAGGIKVYFGYVPSEDNPADAPSRGVHFGARCRRPVRYRTSKSDRYCARLRRVSKYFDQLPKKISSSLSVTSSGTTSSFC